MSAKTHLIRVHTIESTSHMQVQDFAAHEFADPYHMSDLWADAKPVTGSMGAGMAKPRNPRHFVRIEGGRNALKSLRTTQSTLKFTMNYLKHARYTMNHLKISGKPRLRHFLPRFSRL